MIDPVDCTQLTMSIPPAKPNVKKKDFQVIRLSEASPLLSDQHSRELLSELLQSIGTASCVEEQMDVIKTVSRLLGNINKEPCSSVDRIYICLAVELYLTAPLKHPAKYALTKAFNSLNLHAQGACISCVQEGLKSRFKSAMEDKDLTNLISASSALLGCYENFRLGPDVIDPMVLDVFEFLEKTLYICDSFVSSLHTPLVKVEVSKIAHTVSRIIITAMQRMEADTLKNSPSGIESMNNVLKTAVHFMNSPDVPLDTRTNFGFVIVLILECLEGSHGWMKLLGTEKLIPADDEISLLCISSGLLSGLKYDQFELVHSTKGIPIIACVLEIVLLVNERSIQECNLVLALWRVVQQFTRVLSLNPNLIQFLEVAKVEELLKHLWGLLDHYMDSVRHLARAILENVMHLKNALLSMGIDLGERMSEAVQLTPEKKRSRYVILSTMTAHLSTTEIIERIPNVINNLLTAMQYPSMSSHVAGAFVAMSTADFKKLPRSEWFDVWVKPLFHVMEDCSLSEAPALEEALGKIMKLCPSIINQVLPVDGMERNFDPPKLKVLLTCMKIGRKLGVLYTMREKKDLWLGALPLSVLQSALCHEHDEIRVSALALIVETNRTTEFLCETDFMMLRLFLVYNVNCEVPSFRQQVIAFLSKLLYRMKDSAHTLSRSNKQRINDPNPNEILQTYKAFLLWVLPFSYNNLKPGSNYSRRLFSLKLLNLITDILKMDPLLTNNDSQLQMWTEENALTLLSVILVDTFEENKAMATKLLVSYPDNFLGLNDKRKLLKLFQSGCSLASSIHPSDCISAAYILEFCCSLFKKSSLAIADKSDTDTMSLEIIDAIVRLKSQLEKESEVAQCDILEAASRGPMYGTLFCIRHLLQLIPDFGQLQGKSDWVNLIKSLIDLSFKLNEIVSPVVNSSSPEGHLPMDFNKDSTLLKPKLHIPSTSSKVTAQMVLLCSWRTVKEVSLLLGTLSDRCPILPEPNGLLSDEEILAIGVHLTNLLEETKHRGAFEQAYVGFSLLAARLWRHSKKNLQELPQKWLNDLMNAIQNNDRSSNRLCATRRSAGVPFLVQALVSAELQTGGGLHSLPLVMTQLLACAADKERHVECRTHALNILRALYRHAPLAEHIAPYISEGIIVAISGFRVKTWAERNSATLLFSSLMTRIFGVRRSREELSSRNKMTGRVFFHRYPELYAFLLSELGRAVKALDSGDVAELAVLHPILLLIGRLYPSSLEGTDTLMQLNTFIPLVRQCASNSVLKTRVLAAKAVVPLITSNVLVKYVDELIQYIYCACSDNLTHGFALQVVNLLTNASTLNDDQSSVLFDCLEPWLKKILLRLNTFCSNTVREVLLQIVELIVGNWYSRVPLSTWKGVREIITENILFFKIANVNHQLPLGLSILEVRATRVLIQLLILEQDIASNIMIMALLKHSNYEVVQETLNILGKLMARGARVVNEEAEDIIPDIFGSDKNWLEHLPKKACLQFGSWFCENRELGQRLASLVISSTGLQGRLALQALVHVAPFTWCSDININQLLLWCKSSSEGTSCAAFACFSALLKFMIDSNENIPQVCEDGCKLLKTYCDDIKGVVSRMSAVNFLLEHRQALEMMYTFLSDETVCELWMNAIKLISDDNSGVRLQAAKLCGSELTFVSQKSLEHLLENFVTVMKISASNRLATLLALALGPLPDSSTFVSDEERVFERGESNIFIEHEIITDLISKYISFYMTNKTSLSDSQWNWVWEMIGGSDCNGISDAESLFDAVRRHNQTGLSLDDSDFLLPLPIVCSLRRLRKVELLYFGTTKEVQSVCYPFKSNKLFGCNQEL